MWPSVLHVNGENVLGNIIETILDFLDFCGKWSTKMQAGHIVNGVLAIMPVLTLSCILMPHDFDVQRMLILIDACLYSCMADRISFHLSAIHRMLNAE